MGDKRQDTETRDRYKRQIQEKGCRDKRCKTEYGRKETVERIQEKGYRPKKIKDKKQEPGDMRPEDMR